MVSLRSVVAAVALVAAPVMAFTAAQVADGLNELANKARDLSPVADSITPINAALLLLNMGPYPVYLPTPVVSLPLTPLLIIP